MRRLTPLILVLIAACEIRHADSGRLPGMTSEADSLAVVEQDSALRTEVVATLRTYYDRLSARDWRGMRATFWPGGTIATRWTPPGERRQRVWVQTADEYARRAVDGPGKMAVFSERMLSSRVSGYGDVADAWVIYEGRWGRTRDSVGTTRGIDAFHLYRDNGEWRIVSLTFTTEQPGRRLLAPPRRRPVRRATRTRAAP